MTKTCIVTESHTAAYADPIAVAGGDALFPTGRDDVWDGHRWLWAVAADGREGWVPDDLVAAVADGFAAARDYSARELTCTAGESLVVLAETHGWAWCRNHDGDEGWIPLRVLADG